MLVLILSITSFSFIAFFYLLGLWYLGLIPLLLLLFFLFQSFSETHTLLNKHDFFYHYGLYIVTFLAFLGIRGLASGFGLSDLNIIIILGLTFWILRYASYIIPYPDGKKLFLSFFVISIITWMMMSIFAPLGTEVRITFFIGTSIRLFASLLLTLLVGKYFDLKENFDSQITIVAVVRILLLILVLISNPLLALVIDLFLFLLFMLAVDFIRKIKETKKATGEISLRQILSGRKVLSKSETKKKTLPSFLNFLKKDHPAIRLSLEGINISLLFLLIGFYLYELISKNFIFERYYWIGIILFTWNSVLLKKNKMFGELSRFSVALTINFSILLGLMLAKGDNLKEMIPRLIAWNIFCGVLIFYSQIRAIKPYIKKADLISWIIATGLATLVNVYLLTKLELSSQILFSLEIFYIGIVGFIAHYAIKLISKYETINDEKKEEILENFVQSGKPDPLNQMIMKVISEKSPE